MSPIRHVAGLLFQVAGTAIWSWVSTILIMVGVGVLCGGATWLWLRGHAPYDLILAGVVVIECAVAGWMLASKRGLSSALIRGVEQLGIGRSMVNAVMDQVEQKLPGPKPVPVVDEALKGGAATALATTATEIAGGSPSDRRWSITEIETRIQNAVAAIAGERSRGLTGWITRILQARLLSGVETIIRQRVRQNPGAEPQGISFRELRTDLQTHSDRLLTSRFRGLAFKSTFLILGGLFTGLLVQAVVASWGLEYWSPSAPTNGIPRESLVPTRT